MVKAPVKDRCQNYTPATHQSCIKERNIASLYVRRLTVGDQVCIENGLGFSPNAECRARAAVVDASPEALLLEIREAQPASKWFSQPRARTWYQEGALVDQYLVEHGY